MPKRVQLLGDSVSPAERQLVPLDSTGGNFRHVRGTLQIVDPRWMADSLGDSIRFTMGDGMLGWNFAFLLGSSNRDTLSGVGTLYTDLVEEGDTSTRRLPARLMRVSCVQGDSSSAGSPNGR